MKQKQYPIGCKEIGKYYSTAIVYIKSDVFHHLNTLFMYLIFLNLILVEVGHFPEGFKIKHKKVYLNDNKHQIIYLLQCYSLLLSNLTQSQNARDFRR